MQTFSSKDKIITRPHLVLVDFDSALRDCPIKDTASWNTMISDTWPKARDFVFAMPEKNSVSWSAMISGYIECGQLDIS
ncbi:hypothetical protein CUMW_215460 [Citrus unshiu]|uniref:Uncharacterized protein n=1 Tax=Citrus unshiu TaxID=55188 RepID=A0A2H5QBW9_CITUN|nr:hypothetical protein CUMW_215460 [Citrus unshiu]